MLFAVFKTVRYVEHAQLTATSEIVETGEVMVFPAANLAQVTVAQNEDMRKITAWVAIFAVPTMIAGIYGMNFKHMPELS
jgi:Mg2+ and Co2+ transporter CorA